MYSLFIAADSLLNGGLSRTACAVLDVRPNLAMLDSAQAFSTLVGHQRPRSCSPQGLQAQLPQHGCSDTSVVALSRLALTASTSSARWGPVLAAASAALHARRRCHGVAGGRGPGSRAISRAAAGGRFASLSLDSRADRLRSAMQLRELDELLAQEGLQLMVSGSTKSEPASEAGKVYCYMPVLDPPFPDVQSTQVRLTCALQLPRSGLAVLKTDEFAILVEDQETGEMCYDEQWSSRGLVRGSMTNMLAYRQEGSDLRLISTVTANCRAPVPEWFPVPENVFGKFVETFAQQALQAQQNEMLDKFEQRMAELK